MMIAIAIAGSLVAYAWVRGYIDLSTEKAEQAIVVQSIANHKTDLIVYVQNTGEGLVQLEEDSCLYVNEKLVDCTISYVAVSEGIATLSKGETAILTYVNGAAPSGEKVEVKVTTLPGGFAKYSEYPAGTAYVLPVLDHFSFDVIESPQTLGTAFRVTIRALDQYDKQFTSYSGANDLTYSCGTISPSSTGNFSYGLWSGEVTVTNSATDATITTVAQSNSSWTGTSNAFRIDVLSVMWYKTYGGADYDVCSSVVVALDGGYAMVGDTRSFGAGHLDFWLVKTDASGNVKWSKTYGGTEWDAPHSLIATSDGGYAIAGSTDSFGSGMHDMWLVKTDAFGNVEWSETYGGVWDEIGRSVVEASDGGYVLLGEKYFGGVGFWLVKTDAYGRMEWSRTYEGPQGEDAFTLIATSDGGYALAGDTQSFGAGSYDFWLIKTNEDGKEEWNRTYGGTGIDGGFRSIAETSDKGYILAGHTESFGVDERCLWLIKTDAFGNVEWNRTYGDRTAYSLVVTSDGGYAITGYTDSFGAREWDALLVKFDSFGNMEWSQTYGGTGFERACSLIVTSDGGYVLAGSARSSAAEEDDFLLIRLKSLGT